jgi:hypothetical protein
MKDWQRHTDRDHVADRAPNPVRVRTLRQVWITTLLVGSTLLAAWSESRDSIVEGLRVGPFEFNLFFTTLKAGLIFGAMMIVVTAGTAVARAVWVWVHDKRYVVTVELRDDRDTDPRSETYEVEAPDAETAALVVFDRLAPPHATSEKRGPRSVAVISVERQETSEIGTRSPGLRTARLAHAARG